MKKTIALAALALGLAVSASAATYTLDMAQLKADEGSHTLTLTNEDGTTTATTIGVGGYGNFSVTLVLNVDKFISAITSDSIDNINLYTGNSKIGIGITGSGLKGSWQSDSSFTQDRGTSIADLSTFAAGTYSAITLTYTLDGASAKAYLTGYDATGDVLSTVSGSNGGLKTSGHNPLSSFTYNADYVEYFHADSSTIKSASEAETRGATVLAAAKLANVPEPTTATLSLLALAGLAARRRRK